MGYEQGGAAAEVELEQNRWISITSLAVVDVRGLTCKVKSYCNFMITVSANTIVQIVRSLQKEM